MRVGILSLQHESNTFVTTKTDLSNFHAAEFIEGEEIVPRLSDGNHEVSGFLAGMAAPDVELVPLLFARATPSGALTSSTCQTLFETAFTALHDALPLDGLLVAPHGAGVGEEGALHDLDGHWLTKVREIVGASVPIICTMDPHANLSPAMIQACDASISYRSNPHLDQKERGLEAAELLRRTLAGECRPTQAAAFPPMAINIERQLTEAEPCLSLLKEVAEVREYDGVLSASLVLGFPYADVKEMGAAVIVVTDDNPALARELVDGLASKMWAMRSEFVGEFVDVDAAVTEAMATEGPVCLLDMGDNVGGGSAADGTYIAHVLHERAAGPAYVCFYDPEAVLSAKAAGRGAKIELTMGGKTDTLHGPPLSTDVEVCSLHDGEFTDPEVRHGGLVHYQMGETAVVKTSSGLTIALTSQRTAPFSIGQITSCGLNPSDFQILVAKGVHAPVAAYQPVCSRLIRVNTAGSTSADMRKFAYANRRQPLYPLEMDMTWEPSEVTL